MKRLENQWIKLVLSGTVLILIYKLFNNFSDVAGAVDTVVDVLFPIILGAVIAFFLSKPSEALSKLLEKVKVGFIRKKALWISVIFVYAAIALVLVFTVKYITPRVYKNIEEFTLNIPSYYNTIQKFIAENEILSKIDILDISEKKILSLFNINQINKYIGIISGIANGFMTIFLAVILSIYMIIEKENIFSFFDAFSKRFIPKRAKNFIYVYGRKTKNLFYSYFTGLALDAVLVGIVSSLFFSIFKVPYAFLLGLIVAFGNLVPFFGPIIANVVIFVISAITVGPFKALWVILFQFVFAQVDGNVIQPKIISNSTGISPLLVLVAVLVFGDLFGFIGMIVGVPVCAVIKDIVTDYVEDGRLEEIE